MADLAQLLAWRDALLAARFAGTSVVAYGDMRVEYKTDAEMRQALADLDRQIRGTPVSQIRIGASKGV